jgi:DNA-binding beta-propeller fold protein YncE
MIAALSSQMFSRLMSGSFITDAQGVTWKITGGTGGVSVIDTDPASANYNKEIASVVVPNWAQDLVVSGGRLYVTDWDDISVTVIDTATNTIVRSFATDQTRSGRRLWVVGYYEWWDYWDSAFPVAAFSRYITASPNGKVYVTDYGNGTVYAVRRVRRSRKAVAKRRVIDAPHTPAPAESTFTGHLARLAEPAAAGSSG